MPTLSTSQIPPPSNWEDFERLCCDLWRAIWSDPQTQRHGRKGQAQHGVDVFGRPTKGSAWAGVQCKGKDNYTDKTLTEKELRAEVKKAKSFSPPISEFIVATTAPRDAAIQEVARKITAAHHKKGLFSVAVVSWEDIVEQLDSYPKVVAAHFSQFALTETLNKRADAIDATQIELLEKVDKITTATAATASAIATALVPGISAGFTDLLRPFQEQSLDYARGLIRQCKPGQALEYLESQRSQIESQAVPHVKARLISLTGAAHLGLSNERRAAELFVEAHQYSPDDERISANAALGFFLLGENAKANALAEAVLTKNPTNSQARSILVQTSPRSLSEIVAELPDYAKEDCEVAFALATVAVRAGNIEEAEHWYRESARHDTDGHPDIKAALGQTILQREVEHKSSPTSICSPTTESRTRLIEADRLLTEAWDGIPDEAARKGRVAWLVNRGIARRFLDRIGDAIQDFDTVLQHVPGHPVATFHRALAYVTEGQPKRALEFVFSMLNSEECPPASLLAGDLLLQLEGPDAAIAHLQKVIESSESEDIRSSAQIAVLEALLEKGDIEAASAKSHELLSNKPTSVRLLTLASQIAVRKGNIADADALLAKASRCVVASTAAGTIALFAEEAYKRKKYDLASDAYDRLKDPDRETLYTHRFITSCYRAQRFERVLEVCSSLKAHNGVTRFVAEVEAAVHEELGDLEAATTACQAFLQTTPDDRQMQIQLAVLHLRKHNLSAVDALLAKPPAWQDMPVDYGIQLANLFAVRERYREAIELLYEIRRAHPQGKVYLRYIQCFLFHGRQSHAWLEAPEAGNNTAVCVQDAAQQRHWFILDDRLDARIEDGELSQSHRLYTELLGKKVGDSILLKESDIAPEQGTVVEIKSKYVHAFHESAETIQTRFPGTKGFETFHLPKDDDPKPGIDFLLSQVAKRHEAWQKALEVYKKFPIPVAALGHMLGGDVFEGWAAITNERPSSLRVCLGNKEERDEAFSEIVKADTFVVDPVTLMTLTSLHLGDVVKPIVSHLAVVQTTIDLLTESLHKQRAFNRDGFMAVSKEGDHFVRHEISADDVEAHLAALQSLLEWIARHCVVVTLSPSPTYSVEGKERLAELLGDATVDSILAASSQGRILYSDDQRVRALAKGEFNVPGVWSQLVLMHGTNIGAISREGYDAAVIQLASAGHKYTSVDSQVLLAAARKSDWRVSAAYEQVLHSLSGEECDLLPAVGVATEFIYALWNETILPERFDYLVMALLDIAVQRRRTGAFLSALAAAIRARFRLLPVAEHQVLHLLQSWGRMRLL